MKEITYMHIQIINKHVQAITQSCGLGINQAKTIVYYSIATHDFDKLSIMPILVILGPQGTGKSTLISLMKQIVNNPVSIDGRVSPATLRDSLKLNSTAFIEEADNVDEQLILNRYSKQTSDTVVKRQDRDKGFLSTPLNIFGATVLHRRVPFRDAAVDSRSIIIQTQYSPSIIPTEPLQCDNLREIAQLVNWEVPTALQTGRVADTWQPLVQAVLACEDPEWLIYAIDEVFKNTKKFIRGHGYEPQQALIHSLYALSRPEIGTTIKPVRITDIKEHLKAEYEVKLTPRQIDEMCRSFGFSLTRPKGYLTVQPNEQLLQKLISELPADG